jgi:hypothetical protein
VTGFSVAYLSGGNIVNIAEFDKTEIEFIKPVFCDSTMTVPGGSGGGLRVPSGSNSLYLTNPNSSYYIAFRIGSTDEGYFASDGLHINDTFFGNRLSLNSYATIGSTLSAGGTITGNGFSSSRDAKAFCANDYSILDVSSAGNVAVNGGLYAYGYPTNIHGSTYVRFYVDGTQRAYVSSSGIQNSSLAEQKAAIQSAGDTLSVIQNAQIYQYQYVNTRSAPPDNCTLSTPPEQLAPVTSRQYMGFVIGDGYTAPPDCVLSEAGDAVNIYSMAAVCWRGIQELAARVTALEGGDQSAS